MTSIDRTAYPQLSSDLTDNDLSARYSLTKKERAFIEQQARSNRGMLIVSAMLKTRQQLGYFLPLPQIPSWLVAFLAGELGVPSSAWQVGKAHDRKSFYRYRLACRQFLKSHTFTSRERQRVIKHVRDAAYTMSDPADLINVAIELLSQSNTELPAFSTLERLVAHERHSVHDQLYRKIAGDLKVSDRRVLDGLLRINAGETITEFARLKQTPGPATLPRFRAWADRLTALDGLLDPQPFLEGVAHTKIRQFAAEASAYAINDIRGVRNKEKRYTLLLCLLHQTQCRTRDEVVEMFLRRMRKVIKTAQDNLKQLQEKHREVEEQLIGVLGDVLKYSPEHDSDAALGAHVRRVLEAGGGMDALNAKVTAVSTYHQNNYLPFLWPVHITNRTAVFQVLGAIELKSSTQDSRLLKALSVVRDNRKARKPEMTADINLGFASQRWQNFAYAAKSPPTFDRRGLELCVLIHLAEALQNGDIYVEGSEAYADYRAQLLPLVECKKRIPKYCKALNLPDSASAFVADLRDQLTRTAEAIDRSFPDNSEFSIDANGVLHLVRLKPSPVPEGLDEFKDTVYGRLPVRHLLDLLKDVQHWTRYTRNFGPPSGSSPKLPNPGTSYLFAIFGYGCNLGATQTASHAPELVNRQTLRRVNNQHTNEEKLEAALADVIDAYKRFELPTYWGDSNVAIADGTHIELRKNNLLGEQHIRYGGFGGIAYHHISGEYIALFSHFISCGVWEAVYILDALLLNKSSYQPDTLHADTQGQSEPVFALAHLLGIKLFPRMRTWNDVAFYRPDKKTRYKHIDGLFSRTIDWKLIERHWEDMMQVVLSIQSGKVMPSMLLRKLNSNNRRNKLYRAFRELGRVIRTLFLLRYISESELRQTIRAETTKIESFNDFLDWISFGGLIIKSGDPVKQTKQVIYTTLIANAIMLHNASDLTAILGQLASEGHTITRELVAGLSPYRRKHIRRFGKYDVDMKEKPPRLRPAPIPISE